MGALGVTLAIAGELDVDLALKVSGAVLDAVGSVFATIGGVLGITDPDPDCDGEVFTRVMTFLPGELRSQTIGPMTETAKSPSECGGDPHTTVTYAVREAVPHVFPADATLSALSTGPGEASVYVMGLPNASDGAGITGSQVWSKFFPGPNGAWSDWFALGPNVFPTGSSIAALSARPGETGLYVLGLPTASDVAGNTGSQVWTRFFPGPNGGWSDWFALGPNVFSPRSRIAALSARPGESSLYVIGLPTAFNGARHPGGQVWTKFFPGPSGGWSDWFALGPNVFLPDSEVSALSTGPGATSLYAMGLPNVPDGTGSLGSQVWTKFFPGQSGGWSDWFALGPNVFPPSSSVTALSTGPGETSLFVMGPPNASDGAGNTGSQVWTKFFPGPKGGGWSDWFALGPNVFAPGSRVTALSTGQGETSLFVMGLPTGTDTEGKPTSQLWTKFFPGPKDGWSDWFALGPNGFPPSSSVAAVSTAPGGTTLFVMGPQDAIDKAGQIGSQVWSKFFPASNGGWSDWFALTQPISWYVGRDATLHRGRRSD